MLNNTSNPFRYGTVTKINDPELVQIRKSYRKLGCAGGDLDDFRQRHKNRYDESVGVIEEGRRYYDNHVDYIVDYVERDKMTRRSNAFYATVTLNASVAVPDAYDKMERFNHEQLHWLFGKQYEKPELAEGYPYMIGWLDYADKENPERRDSGFFIDKPHWHILYSVPPKILERFRRMLTPNGRGPDTTYLNILWQKAAGASAHHCYVEEVHHLRRTVCYDMKHLPKLSDEEWPFGEFIGHAPGSQNTNRSESK